MDLQQIVTVSNTPGSLIPSTGGMGTYLIYGVGIIALIAAAALVLRRRATK